MQHAHGSLLLLFIQHPDQWLRGAFDSVQHNRIQRIPRNPVSAAAREVPVCRSEPTFLASELVQANFHRSPTHFLLRGQSKGSLEASNVCFSDKNLLGRSAGGRDTVVSDGQRSDCHERDGDRERCLPDKNNKKKIETGLGKSSSG
jgi:hypothetical protein